MGGGSLLLGLTANWSKLEMAVKLNRCVKLKIEHRNYPFVKKKKIWLS